MILCEVCNKEYKRITWSHLNSKLHKTNLKMNSKISFKDLNENLNEYNLIKSCINYSKDTIEGQYKRIKDKLNKDETYKTKFSIEFLKKYIDELDEDLLLNNLNLYKGKPEYKEIFEEFDIIFCNECEEYKEDVIYCDDDQCENSYCEDCNSKKKYLISYDNNNYCEEDCACNNDLSYCNGYDEYIPTEDIFLCNYCDKTYSIDFCLYRNPRNDIDWGCNRCM
jgi:hypothetical protein